MQELLREQSANMESSLRQEFETQLSTLQQELELAREAAAKPEEAPVESDFTPAGSESTELESAYSGQRQQAPPFPAAERPDKDCVPGWWRRPRR